MAKRGELTEEKAKAWWRTLPGADRRFFRALLGVGNIIGDPSLHYAEPRTALRRTLRKADRNTLFSIIAECLYLLLDAPAMMIVKRYHRRRAAGSKKVARSQSNKGARRRVTNQQRHAGAPG